MRGYRLLVMLWATTAAATLIAKPPTGPAPFPQGHALLIGCTSYPHLDVQQLEGPANDVVLMRDLLTTRFGFLKQNIVTLSEAEGKATGDESRRPTRASIKCAFDDLVKLAGIGEQVVILMSGHGSKIPVANPADPLNYEPDGFDEVFLCADAAQVDEQSRTCRGGIIDNDLGEWVQQIADRGAHVWIIVDCCHSGTMLRGPAEEVERRAPMDKLLPQAMLNALPKRAAGIARTRGGAPVVTGETTQLPATLKNVAALYASQPEQSTIELVLPPDSPQRQKYGVLTYHVNEVLTQARGRLTYQELAQRVQAAYTRLGKALPTPFLEGQDDKLEVLGFTEWPHRSAIKIVAVAPEVRIDAGSLHGLTVGTVLALLPPDVADGDKPLGYVKIKQLGSVTSTVENTTYDQVAPANKVPEQARCAVAFLDYGLRKLRVFVDLANATDRGHGTAALKALEASSGLIALAANRSEADWVLHSEDGRLFLEPGSGFDDTGNTPTPRFGPIASDERLASSLGKYLGNIVRAQNLLATAREVPLDHSKNACKLKLELVRLRDKDDKVGGDAIEWKQNGIQLHKDELFGCRLTNEGEGPVDATLLFVDAGYGIEAQFPLRGTRQKRIFPTDAPFLAYRGIIDDTTVGMEHMVLIAVPGKEMPPEEPLDFTVLEQPTLPMVRGTRGGPALHSPLGELLKNAMYGQGGCRGGNAKELGDHQIEVISWRVMRNQP